MLVEMGCEDLFVYFVDGVEGTELVVLLPDVVRCLEEGDALGKEHQRSEDENY